MRRRNSWLVAANAATTTAMARATAKSRMGDWLDHGKTVGTRVARCQRV